MLMVYQKETEIHFFFCLLHLNRILKESLEVFLSVDVNIAPGNEVVWSVSKTGENKERNRMLLFDKECS